MMKCYLIECDNMKTARTLFKRTASTMQNRGINHKANKNHLSIYSGPVFIRFSSVKNLAHYECMLGTIIPQEIYERAIGLSEVTS